ncbi:MAG: SDR family NAD(P)-dependent oxidoreductase [Acidobacteria bacterium]|nr:SDR family NAD(P)-dependent oxidoreductase [Acidobacteriota bacterium]
MGQFQDHFQDKVVLITGASMGVGAGLAQMFAAQGAKVAIAARSMDKLVSLAKSLPGESLVIAADMSQPDQVRDMVAQTVARFGRIDILVNNAAVGMYAAAADMDMAACEHLIKTNWLGPLHAIQAAVPVMRRQGGGQIINISTVAARLPLPYFTAYASTKYAMTAMSDILRMELRPDNIQVLLVFLGRVRTNFTVNAFKGPGTKALGGKMGGISVERAARAILLASRWRRREIVVPCSNRVFGWLRRLAPPLIDRLTLALLKPMMRK